MKHTDIGKAIDQAVEQWADKQFKNPFAALYLYYQPRGNIVVCEEAPAYLLACPERLSPGWTKEQVRYKVSQIIKTLPILSE